DREILDPFDPAASFRLLKEIESNLISLFPGYPDDVAYSGFHVTNVLAVGVDSYMEWLASQKVNQLMRSQTAILLAALLLLLSVRYNYQERKQEIDFLQARGASSRWINQRVIGELLGISLVASSVSLALGSVFSQASNASSGFFQIDWQRAFASPLLISLNTLFTTFILGIVIPIIGFSLHKLSMRKGTPEEVSIGRMAKLSRGLRLIRWDLTVLALSALILVTLRLGDVTLRTDPAVSGILVLLPLALFLGFASLTIKFIDKASLLFSSFLNRITGKTNAIVGGRKISRSSHMAGPVILIFVLSICISLSGAIVADSIPQTHLTHSRYAVGADVTFRLSNDRTEYWSSFAENATSHRFAESGTLVSVGRMYLSEGKQGGVDFIAINALEYAEVGYNLIGSLLNESALHPLLQDMSTNLAGVIISSDIAGEYGLSEGDSLRAFDISGEEESAEFIVLGTTLAVPAPMIPSETKVTTAIGQGRVLVNRDFISSKANLNQTTMNYFCIHGVPGENHTVLAEEVLAQGGRVVLNLDQWESVNHVLDGLYLNPTYDIERGIDTLLTLLAIPTTLSAFVIYEVSTLQSDRKESAILKSLGAESSHLFGIRLSEVLVISLIGLFIVGFYAPLYIANSLEASIAQHRIWGFSFPIHLFTVLSWHVVVPLVLILIFLGAMVTLPAAFLLSRMNLAPNLKHNVNEASFEEA
ncbi:MAG: FtsX-like permease family protein, partial [Candidatus Hodarchaeota archaeon]